jgi:hypothetical protein
MSHVTKTDFTILRSEIDAVEQGCLDLGTVEFHRGQKTHRWYGSFVGDSESGRRYAQEVDPSKWGRCEHAISVKGNRGAYEIGLVENKDGNYDLVFDSWGSGRAIIEACGEDLSRLRQSITAAICEREMARENFLASRSIDQHGNLVIEFER